MPVTLIPPSSDTDRSRCTAVFSNPSATCINRMSKNLTIGLLNNMPDGALESTEQQFLSLLNASSGELSISLSLYSLPGISRGASAQNHIDRHYKSAESLLDSELDGLIVTGKEPSAPNLLDEPFWDHFVRIVEWARKNTCSTVWSCLAAHAAVLYMDGIQRVRNRQKHSGILNCARIANHPITTSLPERFRLPHSRWNGLPESELVHAGYQMLVQTDNAGVDCFVKQEQSLFLFFQSHPEYTRDALLLEYRRDVTRYLRREISIYPNAPQGYFNNHTLQKLAEIEQEASTLRREETFTRLATLLSNADIEDGWNTTAATLYQNWLQYISSAKKAHLQKKHTTAMIAQETQSPALLHPTALVAQ